MPIYTIRKIKDAVKNICCICNKEFEGYGNNPFPIKESGYCCDSCNYEKVIPARINQLNKNKKINDADPKEELAALIKSEEDAIILYENAIKNSVNEDEKALYQHILDEEKEHLKMLKDYLETGNITIL